MPSRSRFLASQTNPGPNIELAVARKSSFRDSTDEQVSATAAAKPSGISVLVGAYGRRVVSGWLLEKVGIAIDLPGS